jgi:hypothetical protein
VDYCCHSKGFSKPRILYPEKISYSKLIGDESILRRRKTKRLCHQLALPKEWLKGREEQDGRSETSSV